MKFLTGVNLAREHEAGLRERRSLLAGVGLCRSEAPFRRVIAHALSARVQQERKAACCSAVPVHPVGQDLPRLATPTKPPTLRGRLPGCGTSWVCAGSRISILASSSVRNKASCPRTSSEMPSQLSRWPPSAEGSTRRTSHSSSRITTRIPGARGNSLVNPVLRFSFYHRQRRQRTDWCIRRGERVCSYVLALWKTQRSFRNFHAMKSIQHKQSVAVSRSQLGAINAIKRLRISKPQLMLLGIKGVTFRAVH